MLRQYSYKTLLLTVLIINGATPVYAADNDNDSTIPPSSRHSNSDNTPQPTGRDVFGHPLGTNVQGNPNDLNAQGNRPKDVQGNPPHDIYGNKTGSDK